MSGAYAAALLGSRGVSRPLHRVLSGSVGPLAVSRVGPVTPDDDSLTAGPASRQVSSVWLVVAGIVSVQVGAAIAKDLFSLVPPTAMVWLRLATSAVILVAIARPRLRGRSSADWRVALGFGVSLMTMNWAIYQSFARIPLGIAVTIEFLGPLTVAVLGSRRPRDVLWVLLAGAGVALLGISPGEVTVAGALFALLAGAAWAA